MARFAIKTLEFDKVKAMLAAKAATFLGKQQVTALQIESDFAKVKALQEETAEALRIFDEGKRFPFGGAFNITADVKRAELGSVLLPEELLHILTTVEAFGSMKEFLAANGEMAPALAAYAEQMQQFPRLEKQIASAIDEHAEIKDTATPKLGGLRNAIQISKNRVKDKLDSILHDPNNQKYFQDNIVTMRGDRYVIPVKQEYKMNFPGIVHDQSGTGATLFIEPLAVVNLNNDIKRYVAEEREEMERILRQLTQNVGQDAAAILATLELFTKIDVICAKALLAQEQHAVRPMMVLNGKVDIQQGRHPLLNKDIVVPLDVQLGEKFTMLLVTGPNTGGKTVALKAVGLFALMAQIGLFIPALSAALPVFRAVYADIGDEQSIEQSLSTFSAHMTNLISILSEVKAGDLVLVDEICAGTDPNEGAALAMSMLEHLHEQKVLTMVTTHYSELKTFAYGHEGMENASVEFDPISLRPTYRLLMGVPGSSNAFNISRRLGLSEAIIEQAGQLLNQEHVHMENVLQELDSERRRYESGSAEIEALRKESEQLRNALAYSKAEFERRKNDMLRKAKEQADDIYRRSRRESEAVLKELRSMKADYDAKRLEQAAEAARKKLNKTLSEDAPLPEGAPLTAKTAKKGLNVFVISLGKNGVITDVKGNEVTVQVGILKMNVPAAKCLLTKAQPANIDNEPKKRKGFTKNAAANYAHQMFVAKSGSAKQEIDLRGMTLDEAIPAVDKAIDDALIAGIGQLRLIHGKGTGALRAGLTAYLENNCFVKKLETAALDAGGSGATVIDL
ncbi:endonuclease MutS2 [uncultured Phascolarctobacterium sp.]|uniref:endonuclease MutS2 n=1 Tax=uncultured Phascolarctobacterium sp. TaxID=512296 RepID=UPI00261A09C4|nr:endonuclease MutS2 [uncultured Phascolarctobacterium sp.]